jgi:hypothetical protein
MGDQATTKDLMAMVGIRDYENPERKYTHPRKRDSDRRKA